VRSEGGFLHLHADSRGGSTFVVADTRSEADLIYGEAFGGECLREDVDTNEDFAEWATVLAEEDFVGAAVIYYHPDDVERVAQRSAWIAQDPDCQGVCDSSCVDSRRRRDRRGVRLSMDLGEREQGREHDQREEDAEEP
jgi:hypothetical protein